MDWETGYEQIPPLTLRHDGPPLTLRPFRPQEATTVAAEAKANWQAGRHLRLAVDDSQGLAGWVDLVDIDRRRGRAGIGWWTVADRHGRGIARRSARALIDVAHRDLGLHRVEARIAAGNHGSRAVAAAAGLHLEVTLQQTSVNPDTGEHVDVEVWRLLADESPLDLNRSSALARCTCGPSYPTMPRP